MMKVLVIVLALAAVAAAAGTGLYLHQRTAKAAATTLPVDTYTAAADHGDITQSVSATGPVVSNLDVQIKCRASGEVVKLPYDISDPVKKGDLLIQLDTQDEAVVLEQAQVNLQQSKSKLKEA